MDQVLEREEVYLLHVSVGVDGRGETAVADCCMTVMQEY